jgi:hypothetical protein
LYNNEVKNDSKKLNNKAHQKPSTRNPLTSFSANKMIIAFITKRNSPNVKTVIGSVKSIRSGLTMAFKIANTIATMIAVQKESNLIPVRRYDKPKATIEVTISRMMRFIGFTFR